MIINFDLTEKENLLNYLNHSLDEKDGQIGLSDIEFSKPSPIIGVGLDTVNKKDPNSEYIYNTEVTVIPSAKFNYEAPTKVEYRRVDLGLQWQILNGEHSLEIDHGKKALTDNEIFEALKPYIPLVKERLTVSVEELNQSAKRIRIYPDQNSLIYIGELSVVFNVSSKTSLHDLFNDGSTQSESVSTLNGFEYEIDSAKNIHPKPSDTSNSNSSSSGDTASIGGESSSNSNEANVLPVIEAKGFTYTEE